VSQALSRSAGDAITWGPACPDAALRAWGQQAVNGLEDNQETPAFPVQPAVGTDEEGEHIMIGRLTRRMRISEHPALFQALATNMLRVSLRMAAVAWVPREPHEAVVVSGEIEGLRAASYRSLISTDTDDSAYPINNEPAPRLLSTRFLSRYASVPAGSRGWLIAVNPLPDRPIGTAEIERMQCVASLIATQFTNARTYGELKDLLFGILRALTAAIDAKDPYTCGHSERVARIAVRLAAELGMPARTLSDMYLTGLLHDIGKIGVDDGVLRKTGPLTPDEYLKTQAHVKIGVTILNDLRKLSQILPGVRHHHERMDGAGYPDHLSGEAIPLEARILAVADSFDAMSSNRPYRKHLSSIQIDEALRKGRGSQWDPKVVDAVFSCRMDLEAIRQKGSSENLIGVVNVGLGRS
jgi:hypothetical protein